MEKYYPIIVNDEGNGFSVINAGTAPTPCCLTLIPKATLRDITITGLTTHPIQLNFVINAYDVVVIDGENGVFKVNDELEWDKYEGWELPRLIPGTNEITITNASLFDVEIGFDLRYV